MKNNLKITVAGQCGSGKSRVTLLLKEFLKEKGFDVAFDGGVDFDSEFQFDETIKPHLDEAIDSLSKRTKITMEEVQVNREGRLGRNTKSYINKNI